MKRISFLIAGIMLVALLSACGTAPTIADKLQSSINVTGNGQVRIIPDVAYINIGVHSEAEEVTAALEDNTRQAEAISAILREMGVAEEDIQTTAFNVYPKQDFSPTGEMLPLKYAVDNTVMITVRDLTSMGRMLDAVVQAGANSINSISFDVQDKEAAYSEARRLAVENARQQAQELAAAAGVEAGDVIAISAYSSGPGPVYDIKTFQGQGGASVPISAGQIIISVDANVSFQIK